MHVDLRRVCLPLSWPVRLTGRQTPVTILVSRNIRHCTAVDCLPSLVPAWPSSDSVWNKLCQQQCLLPQCFTLSAPHWGSSMRFWPGCQISCGKPRLGAKYTVQQNVIQKQLSTASADVYFWQKLADERNRCPWLLTVLMTDMPKRWLKGTKCSSSDGYLEWSKNKNWRRQRIALGVCNKNIFVKQKPTQFCIIKSTAS